MGPSSAQKKGHTLTQFSASVLWPKGCMDEDTTWYGSRPRPGHIVLAGDPAPFRERGTAAPPLFGPCLLYGHGRPSQLLLSSFHKLECGPMAALSNISGALCSTPQSLADATTVYRAVTLLRGETRLNLLGFPKLAIRSQPLVGRSSPYCEDM